MQQTLILMFYLFIFIVCLASSHDCCVCLFAGELEVASAKNVILYTTLSNKSQDRENGLCGLLVVTNFKLSFLTSDSEQVRNAHTHNCKQLKPC